jgi:hypothetical protein
VADFYAARSATITPLPWQTFAPPFPRGSRATPFATWENYVEARDGAASHTASAEAPVCSQTVNGMIADILKLIVAIAAQVRRDTAEPFETRADHLLEGMDAILAENAALRAKFAEPRYASVNRNPVEQANPVGDDAAPARRSPFSSFPAPRHGGRRASGSARTLTAPEHLRRLRSVGAREWRPLGPSLSLPPTSRHTPYLWIRSNCGRPGGNSCLRQSKHLVSENMR